jgi:hypothetical protein
MDLTRSLSFEGSRVDISMPASCLSARDSCVSSVRARLHATLHRQFALKGFVSGYRDRSEFDRVLAQACQISPNPEASKVQLNP